MGLLFIKGEIDMNDEMVQVIYNEEEELLEINIIGIEDTFILYDNSILRLLEDILERKFNSGGFGVYTNHSPAYIYVEYRYDKLSVFYCKDRATVYGEDEFDEAIANELVNKLYDARYCKLGEED